METRRDLRRNIRRSCEHQVTVMWRGPQGEDKYVSTKVVDISELGLRLQMPEGMQRQTYLVVSAPKLGLSGQASVRHSGRIKGAKFAVGVEFASGMRWKPKE